MPSATRQLVEDQPRYTMAQLRELRRTMVRFCRSIPPGPERNGHRQIALSLRRLFQNKTWLDAHTVEGSQTKQPEMQDLLV
jgi:hypothetical protein